MNYKIFLSLATTGRWERIVHIDQDLQWCPIHYLHITKPVICTVIYKDWRLSITTQYWFLGPKTMMNLSLAYILVWCIIHLWRVILTSCRFTVPLPKHDLCITLSQWIEHHVQATLAANCSPTLSASFSNSLLKGRSKYYNRDNNICI